MALVNTTIIPLNDDAAALQQYSDLIASDKILMVILGDSESIFKKGKNGADDTGAIPLADELADTSPQGFSRGIMWISNHVVLKDKLEPFLHEANIIEADTPYEEIKAFCLTLSPRKANSRVHKNGVLDFVRLEQLFVEAELKSL